MAPPRLQRLSGPESNFLLGPNKRAVIEPALGVGRYLDLPADLRRVMPEEVWMAFDAKERQHLAAIYNRMATYGLWRHVSKVVGVKEEREADAHLLGVPTDFAVEGSSGGIAFETADADLFYESVFAAGFGMDQGLSGALHPGQTSTRESVSGDHTTSLAGPDGLHLSLGSRGAFDAHIDRIAPNDPTAAGRSRMDGERMWQHGRREVEADVVRDKVRRGLDLLAEKTRLEIPFVDVELPGVTFGPTFEPDRRGVPDDRDEPPIMVDVTLRK